MRKTLIAMVASLLVWLPLSIQAEDGTAQNLGARLASFQQKLDAAFVEATTEAQREADLWAKREEELRRRGITVQGGSTTSPAERLLANVEKKMEPEKMALRKYLEDFLGLCLEEVTIGLNPLPNFSIRLRPIPPNETCA